MRRLKYCFAAGALVLNFGSANADTFQSFSLLASGGPYSITGSLTVDQTTEAVSAFSISTSPTTTASFSIINNQGQQGSEYFLNVKTPVFGFSCSDFPTCSILNPVFDDLQLAFNDGGLLSSFTGGSLDPGENLSFIEISVPNTSFTHFDMSGTLDAVSATPLPAALPLFAGGAGLIGLLARRRKRKAARYGGTKLVNLPGSGDKLKSKVWGLAVGLSLFGSLPAMAATYDFTGPLYTSNTDPTDFGLRMTGIVTINYDPADTSGGIFACSGSCITSLQLTSGIYTTSSFDPGSYLFLFGDQVLLWNVIATGPGLTMSAGGQSVCCNSQISPQIILTNVPIGQPEPFASHLDPTGNSLPGSWSLVSATPLPAALPLFAGGACLIGLLARRRRQKAALAT